MRAKLTRRNVVLRLFYWQCIGAVFSVVLCTVSANGQLAPLGQATAAQDSSPAADSGSTSRRLRSPQGTDFLLPPTNLDLTDNADNAVDPSNSAPRSRIQSGIPRELILPPPSADVKRRANRFVADEIDPELQLSLVTGRPKIIQLAQTPVRIYIPNNDVIDAEVLDEESGGRNLALTGTQAGTSTLTLWFEDPTAPNGQSVLSYLVRVYDDPIFARPIEELTADLNQTFPNSFVELEELGDRLIVRGQARDAIEMAQILQILVGARGVRAGVQTIDRGSSVINSLNFVDQNDPAAADAAIAESRRQIDPVALARAGIINLMQVPGEQQVSLKVTVAQVDRSAARSIGLNFDINNDGGEQVFGQFAGGLLAGAGAGAGAAGGAATNLIASLDGGQVNLAIDALRNLSLARTLAEPNLVAFNGQSASFQSGGSFPIPVIGAGGVGGGGGGANLQGVQFVPFGVQLQFTPNIRDRDVIRLQINADISALDASVGTSIGGGAGGTSVSGISNQSFQTTVQLRSGQTLAVAGLIQSSFAGAAERVPLLGDLPVLGNLAGARDTTSSQTELVILVTPELIGPVSSSAKLPLPGDDSFEPSDIEFYLSNRLESRRSRDHRAPVRTDRARQVNGEFPCVEDLLIGPVGRTDRCRPVVSPNHAAVSSTTDRFEPATSSVSEKITDQVQQKSGGENFLDRVPLSDRFRVQPRSSSRFGFRSAQ